MLVCQSVQRFVPDWIFHSVLEGFCTDIHGAQRLNPNDFWNPLTFVLVPPADQSFHLFNEISQHLPLGLSLKCAQIFVSPKRCNLITWLWFSAPIRLTFVLFLWNRLVMNCNNFGYSLTSSLVTSLGEHFNCPFVCFSGCCSSAVNIMITVAHIQKLVLKVV